MARRPRGDTVGSWHHVMNRSVARRPLFETRADVRAFLACLARAVRRGELEVHAFAVLTTHFHLLVRSPRGELSRAMRRIQNDYVRRFNRARRRDGPLVRGRFRSKPVGSLAYRRQLLRYIDGNPVQAGLCRDPCAYPFGSARLYARPRGPRWLARDWVEGVVAAEAGARRYDPRDYPRTVDAGAHRRIAELVAARLDARATTDDTDSLLGMASPEVLRWLRRGASRADGAVSMVPAAAASAISEVVTARAERSGRWPVGDGTRPADGWQTLHAGLLRDVAGASLAAIAARVGVSTVHAGRLAARHRRLLASDAGYGSAAAAITRAALDRTHGDGRTGGSETESRPTGAVGEAGRGM